MPRILFWYLSRAILLTSLSVGCVLLLLVWLVQAVKIVELVLNSYGGLGIILKISGYILPDLLTLLLPISMFIGTIFVYYKLISDREITMMRVAGLSNMKLAFPGIVMGLLVMCFMYLNTCYIAPTAMTNFRQQEDTLRNSLPAILVQEGTFTTLGDVTIFVQKKIGQHKVHGIFAHIEQKDKNPYALMAEEGMIIDSPDGPQVIMRDGNRQELDFKKKSFAMLHFEKTALGLTEFNDKKSTKRQQKPYELSMIELVSPNFLSQPIYNAEFHQRLQVPLLVLAFMLIGIVTQLTSRFTRQTQIRAIFFSGFCALMVQGIFLFFSHLAATHLMLPYLNYFFLLIILSSLMFMLSQKESG